MAIYILILTILVISSLSLTESHLTFDYYNKTCPDFPKIINQIIVDKQIASPTTAAGVVRLFFHDCVVDGCDASLLITSNPFNKAERDTEINESLAGDAFDLVVRAKTALELQCPSIVSCADILAVATRDLVAMVGGPHYTVRLGRKDGFESKASKVEGHIGRPNMTITQLLQIFASKGLNVQDMVALSGAHTIGFAHCSEFSNRIFNFNNTSSHDPSLNPKYAEALKKLCADYKKDDRIAAFNDAMTPGKFDNMYYINLKRGLGLLASDQAMAFDPRTKPFVDRYAANQDAFFAAFAHAMEKVSVLQVKMGNNGEVRRRCDVTNKSPSGPAT